MKNTRIQDFIENKTLIELQKLKQESNKFIDEQILVLENKFFTEQCAEISKSLKCEVKYRIRARYCEGMDVNVYIYVNKVLDEEMLNFISPVLKLIEAPQHFCCLIYGKGDNCARPYEDKTDLYI